MIAQDAQMKTARPQNELLNTLLDNLKIWLKKLSHPGLWITVFIVFAYGYYPIADQSIEAAFSNAPLREGTFTILMSIVLVSSLNMLLGYTGYVSFGHIVFYGLGGYVGLYTIIEHQWSLWKAMAAGGAAAGLLALLLGSAILRLRGSYFALATIGINEAMRAFVSNYDPFGGATGLSIHFRVYRETYGSYQDAFLVMYKAMLGLAIAAVVLSYLVKSSKFGLGLMAIREDEDASDIMGVVPYRSKIIAYVLSAILPGMVGVVFFFKSSTIEPAAAFKLHTSIEWLVMIMLGGFGTIMGPVLGALGYQRLRTALLTSELFKDTQLAVAGALLLAIILFIPAGLIGWLRRRIPFTRRILT